MPVSERLISNRASPGVDDGFSTTLIGCPMAGGMISLGAAPPRTGGRHPMSTETIEVTGHIVDSLVLAKILDTIVDSGCDYEIEDVHIGKTSLDPSTARIAVIGDEGKL